MLVSALEPAEDERLIEQAAGGDRAAFGELYLRYARMVHAILLARVPPGDAEDLVQEVFLTAMNRMGELRTAAAFRGWLGAIARRRAIDHFRDGRRRAALSASSVQHGHAPAGDRALVTLDLLRRLPEAYRETLIMRLVEGMTGPEIAEQTGLTPDSVRVNLCRGMKLLRELWKGDAHA
jgi:RNA polymerase sigma-70 factor (ECF subfamily)